MKTWILAKSSCGDIEPFAFTEEELQPQLGEIIPEELIGDKGWTVVKIYNWHITKTLEAMRNLWSAISGCDDGFFDLISVIIRDAIKESRKKETKTKKPPKGKIFYNTSVILQKRRTKKLRGR